MCRDFSRSQQSYHYNLKLHSPPSSFKLPDYAEEFAKVYVAVSPISCRRRRYNPRVREFVDDEADQGEEFKDDSSASS
jgi:hypothetical protein